MEVLVYPTSIPNIHLYKLGINELEADFGGTIIIPLGYRLIVEHRLKGIVVAVEPAPASLDPAGPPPPPAKPQR